MIQAPPPPEHGKIGEKRKSRIKARRHKWRPPVHNCPQCGQFPGAHAGVKTGEKIGVWGQESQTSQYFKEIIGVKPHGESK